VLVCEQPVLRRFWYPVMPLSHLRDGPQPFRLLGEDIVLWVAEDNIPVALSDRCCHRTAKLSRGYCERNRLVCGYHGWEYDPTGRVVRVPQSGGEEDRPTRMTVPSFNAAARYGYVWVALDEPTMPLPDFEEEREAGFRQIDEFYEVWNCAGLRVMENSFDNAHFSFVHRKSFGDQGHPVPAKLEIENTADGFLMLSSVPVRNPEIQRQLLHMETDRTVRHMRAHWYMPFTRKLRINYPNGMIHSIVTAATPIDDRSSQIVQFCFRNDSEAEAPATDVIAFDRQVTFEDQDILESTDYDVPLDQLGSELNMASDRPGILMRRMLRDLLERHGEPESRREPPRRGIASIHLASGQ
jgi:phenylpropionate dioxygenase-like ring-hydroxylating dioxygenase large terminal subunit